LFSLKKRRHRGHLMVAFQYNKGRQRRTVYLGCSDMTRDNGFKMKTSRFALHEWKTFFCEKIC